MDQRVDALGKVPLFRGLSQRQLSRILKGTLDYRFKPGKELVREAGHGETLFVILEGTARVVRRGRTIARLRAGQFFGEVAVLDGRPRTASVLAESELRCLVLHRDDPGRSWPTSPGSPGRCWRRSPAGSAGTDRPTPSGPTTDSVSSAG
jgi:signal-transduction protein with cAMP-binding, CBS, and nucleotidyltransferase domain